MEFFRTFPIKTCSGWRCVVKKIRMRFVRLNGLRARTYIELTVDVTCGLIMHSIGTFDVLQEHFLVVLFHFSLSEMCLLCGIKLLYAEEMECWLRRFVEL